MAMVVWDGEGSRSGEFTLQLSRFGASGSIERSGEKERGGGLGNDEGSVGDGGDERGGKVDDNKGSARGAWTAEMQSGATAAVKKMVMTKIT